MNDRTLAPACSASNEPASADVDATPGTGTEPGSNTHIAWRWLAATLDEVDYGILLLTDTNHVLHINHAARAELNASHPLQLLGRQLRARQTRDVAALHAALREASERGLRRLLTLGEAEQSASISVVPLSAQRGEGRRATLVLLAKRRVCEQLSVHGFARSHGLTPAETRVLVSLCDGIRLGEVAAQLGVAVSTVRTHACTIRMKTGAKSIRALLRQVAVLPPLMGVLRALGNGLGPASNDDELLMALE